MGHSSTINDQNSDVPMTWKTVMIVVAVTKAAVIGASVGLAALGALDIAFAATAREWITEVQREYYFDYFALGGGVIGAIWQAIKLAFFR